MIDDENAGGPLQHPDNNHGHAIREMADGMELVVVSGRARTGKTLACCTGASAHATTTKGTAVVLQASEAGCAQARAYLRQMQCVRGRVHVCCPAAAATGVLRAGTMLVIDESNDLFLPPHRDIVCDLVDRARQVGAQVVCSLNPCYVTHDALYLLRQLVHVRIPARIRHLPPIVATLCCVMTEDAWKEAVFATLYARGSAHFRKWLVLANGSASAARALRAARVATAGGGADVCLYSGDVSHRARRSACARLRDGDGVVVVATDAVCLAHAEACAHADVLVHFDVPTRPEFYAKRICQCCDACRPVLSVALAKRTDWSVLHTLTKDFAVHLVTP